MSTSTEFSGSVCASGIHSSVRLAAWIAASRAVPMTSPFGASPASDRGGGLRRHPHDRARDRDAIGLRLGADVDHVRPALGVEMRQQRGCSWMVYRVSGVVAVHRDAELARRRSTRVRTHAPVASRLRARRRDGTAVQYAQPASAAAVAARASSDARCG